MRDLAVPHLAALHRHTGHTVHLGVLRDFDVVYLEKVPSARAASVPVGARQPANCTSVGKVLLAHRDLDELAATLPSPLPRMTPSSIHEADALLAELRAVRDLGVATEHEESRLGIASLAAPIIAKDRTFMVRMPSSAKPRRASSLGRTSVVPLIPLSAKMRSGSIVTPCAVANACSAAS